MAKTGVVAGVAAVVVLAGAAGAYLYAVHRGQDEVARAVAQFRRDLGPNGSLVYAGSSIHPLSHSATLEHVVLQTGDGTHATADTLEIAPGGPDRLRALHGTDLVVTRATGTLKASRIDADSIAYAPSAGMGATDAAMIDPARLSWSSLRMDEPDFSGAGGRLTAATLRIDHYGVGRKSRVSVQTGTMTQAGGATPASAQLASLRLSGFDLASEVDGLEHATPMKQEDGTFDGEAETFTLTRGDKMLLSIDRVVVKDRTDSKGSGEMEIRLTGATSTPATAQGAAMLNAIGLSAVHWSMSMKGRSDAGTGTAQVSPWTLTARDLGTVELGMDYANVFPDELRKNGTKPFEVFAQLLKTAQLAGMRLVLTDNGLRQRLFAARGKTMNMNADQVRQMAVAALQSPQVAALMPADDLRDAIDRFVAHGGTLSLTMAPQPPMPIAELASYGQTYRQDPAAALNRLGVSARWSGEGDVTP
ncbi:hypothetical protein NFI95_14055 [Acetobacteraceae bacterium KSS8]|uniref:DUF945 domain-containing protein n=1 Tax=Endosaccharibacter trunci TaxID=2812733 RepID=A0ABT1W9K3_9PROT|nr:hypothetical protein [Acetobacteraceae bacterium KSS8]